MLIGFTVVAAPLLFAIVNAAVQMNRLSNESEQLVVRGMQGTSNNQRMFVEIASLERTARLYQILPSNDLLEVYAKNQAHLDVTLDELLRLPLDGQAREDIRALKADAQRHARDVATLAPNSPQMADLVSSYPQMSDLASKISNRVSGQIDRELEALQQAAQLAQQNLFWQSLLLVPWIAAKPGTRG
jgi:two-component system, NtrC family, sensor histidine kinase GlrK